VLRPVFSTRREYVHGHVSILVLLDSCAKTSGNIHTIVSHHYVSILVLLDSCAKTESLKVEKYSWRQVSILVLLDSCAKTLHSYYDIS